ncbi:hypothetical protein ISCGN_031299 [Ixodes scapularis]
MGATGREGLLGKTRSEFQSRRSPPLLPRSQSAAPKSRDFSRDPKQLEFLPFIRFLHSLAYTTIRTLRVSCPLYLATAPTDLQFASTAFPHLSIFLLFLCICLFFFFCFRYALCVQGALWIRFHFSFLSR